MAQFKQHQTGQTQHSNVEEHQRVPSTQRDAREADSPRARLYEEARRLINSHDYEGAYHLVQKATGDDALRNVKGICLMRTGNYDDALRLYRSLVLQAAATWMKPETPLTYKLNFATALLLAGHPAGCVEVLAEIDREDHPSVMRLRQTLQRWKGELPLWKKLQWWFGQEPAHQVTLDFLPGELDVADV